jgi:acetyl/propionyl-CoA carboxylase alpha subunit
MDQDSDSPYFLEMNTRLQVEHPVTEFITGVDLVEWQLLAAAGERLPLVQGQIRAHGHAIEARITAERADLGFQPVTGQLSVVDAPRGLRFDTGVAAGSEIGLYYDSLLAKLIAHGTDRKAALARLGQGLSDLALLGIPTTQAFLRDAVRQPLFADGRATTRFIEKSFPDGWKPDADDLLRLRAAGCVVWSQLDTATATSSWISPWQRRSATRVTSAVRLAKVLLRINDEYGEADAELSASREGIVIEIDGVVVDFEPPKAYGGFITLLAPGSSAPFVAQRDNTTVSIAHQGLALKAAIRPRIDIPRDGGGLEHSGNAVEAPLHGVVAKLHVALGDVVEKGTPVLQMEAMKLIHTLKASVPGRIEQINCHEGDTVPAGAILIEISPVEVEEKP